MRKNNLRFIATVLACSIVVVAPAFADKSDKSDKSDKKHGNNRDKHEDGGKQEAKWSPADLSKGEREDWKGGRPPGWSQGEKRGWAGRDCPPGLAKKGQCPPPPAVVDPWRAPLDRLGKWGRDHQLSQPTRDAMLVSFEGAVRHGVPISMAEHLVMVSAERGVSPYGIEVITRALAYGADRKASLQELGAFAEQGVNQHVAADAIALGMYRLVAQRR